MRVILHIGSTKTGSSALQATLFARRDALRSAGALYSARGVAAGAHHVLAAAIHPGAWRMHLRDLPADRAPYFAETAAAIVAEAAAADVSTIIISSEYFWGSFQPAVYTTFAAAFPGAAFDVIAFIRRQDEWAASSYLQAVKSGEKREFAEWMAHALQRPNSGLHYFRVINRWAYLLGAKVHVIRYEDARENVYRAFCDTFGLEVETDIELARVNPSPTADGLGRLLEVNRSTTLSEPEKAAERARIMKAHKGHRGDSGLAAVITDAERKALVKASETSDRLIARQFLGRELPLFDAQDETQLSQAQPAPDPAVP